MSKHDTFVNGRSVIHKGSKDTATGFPDVCKTPIGTAVVPIPYPNISKSSTLKKGSKSVKINGQPAALDNSYLASSTGDEAGTLGGVASGTKGDKTHFVSCSFDVRIEGQGVIRHAETTTHNNRNTVGMIMGSSAPIGDPFADAPDKCPYCGKPEHDFAKKWGNSNGNSQDLRKNIIPNIKDHRWYIGGSSLAVHHLICVEAMANDLWYDYCMKFGYDIDHKNNGVILPMIMQLACQLHAALHVGSHSKGIADSMSYPDRVNIELNKIAKQIEKGKYCDNPSALIEKLDRYSKRILKNIDTFRWTLTADGKDYQVNANGCSGVTSVKNKPNQVCKNRQHGLTRPGDSMKIPKKDKPLQVGK